MLKVVYVGGRYRHYRPDRTLDPDLMALEIEDEMRWAVELSKMGHFVIPPLHLTVPLAEAVGIPQAEWIDRDLRFLRAIKPKQGVCIFRPGWGELFAGDSRPIWYPEGIYPVSRGCEAEHECALGCGVEIADAHVMRADVVLAYMRQQADEDECGEMAMV